MRQPLFTASGVRIIGAALLMMAFGGCSADDIEFNGGLFNAVGLGNANKAKKSEPQMAARSPIVLPPNLERLPQPGEQQGGTAADVAAIDDPDKKLVVNRAELEKQQAAYCKVNYEQALAHGDRTTAELANGPLGPCRGSVLNAIDVNIGSAE